MLTSLPLNEKEDVRAETCSSLIRASELRISSVRPSEKYSCSLSPLMFTNGSTAMECDGGLKAAALAGAGACAAGAAGGVAGARRLATQSLSTTKYPSATASSALTTHSAGLEIAF